MDKPFVLVDERKWGESVPRQVYTQVVWERNVVLDQLASIGKGLGEKMDDVEKVIRCADCRHFRCNLRPDGYLPEGVGETECTLFHVGMDYIDFCSHGERRNDD